MPAVAALLTLLIGLADVYTVFRPLPQHLGRLKVYVPGTVTNVTRSADVIVGLLLLLLSHGLRRRKKRAWQAVTGLLAFDCGIHFFHWHHVGFGPILALTIALGLLFILVYFREEFYAQGDLRNRWKAFWVGGWLIVADLVIGLGYIYGLGGLADDYSPWQRVQEVVYGLVGVSGVVEWENPARADLFNDMTTALGIFTLIVTVYLFLRPAEPQPRLSRNDSERIRELLDKHGDRDSLGYFALRDDKSVLWSPTGKACICYRVVSGVMLASGDPIGDPEAWPGVIGPFLDEAARHAWAPAVMGCSELGAEVWVREGGLTALELGDEAIVEVADFSLSGRSMRNVRQMVSRVARSGYTAEVRRVGDLQRAEVDQIIEVADSWRGTPTERGFSMALGRIGATGDDDCVLVTAKQDGVIKAVLQLVPWGTDGLSLDLMRRDRNAQPGLNDFLIVETIKAASALGVKRLSLNFAVFRAALERGERIGAGPVLRVWRKILVFMSRWFQIESLYKFNAKFSPQWQPRFFVFTGAKDTPRVALAALEAEAFLVWPKVRLRRLGRQVARKLGLGTAARRLGLVKR
ncbi:MAG TPA: phosphatidylglycerol lysyltransferase domain-containing protein [Streptosporangiaceae bacterium]|nr:phosphatidylglycerol lysyltransferase domain-containing protein [Streptosporangiaceae bacterium]